MSASTDIMEHHEDLTESALLQFGSIGGFIGLCVIFSLLYHLLYSYDHQKSKTKIYVLNMLYFLCGIMVCSIYAFVRSNLVLSVIITNSTFSLFRCQVGFYGGLVMVSFNKILLFVLMQQRIKFGLTAFGENTAIIYSQQRFTSLYFILLPFICIGWILTVYISQQDALNWILVTHESVMYCNLSQHQPHSTLTLLAHLVCTLGEMVVFFVLLFLLFAVLKSLQKVRVLSYREKVKLQNMIQLIKKQAIIVMAICILSALLFSVIAWDFNGSTWICWDTILKSFCMWLLTNSGKTCWGCCIRYGICCYFYDWRKADRSSIHVIGSEINNKPTPNTKAKHRNLAHVQQDEDVQKAHPKRQRQKHAHIADVTLSTGDDSTMEVDHEVHEPPSLSLPETTASLTQIIRNTYKYSTHSNNIAHFRHVTDITGHEIFAADVGRNRNVSLPVVLNRTQFGGPFQYQRYAKSFDAIVQSAMNEDLERLSEITDEDRTD